MMVEELNVSEECRDKLKNAGFATVDEIVEFLEQSVGTGVMVTVVWAGECFDETVNQLKLMGRWSDGLQ